MTTKQATPILVVVAILSAAIFTQVGAGGSEPNENGTATSSGTTPVGYNVIESDGTGVDECVVDGRSECEVVPDPLSDPVSDQLADAATTHPLDPAPTPVRTALANAAKQPGFVGLDVSISIWIDGWGEVVAINPDLPLTPVRS